MAEEIAASLGAVCNSDPSAKEISRICPRLFILSRPLNYLPHPHGTLQGGPGRPFSLSGVIGDFRVSEPGQVLMKAENGSSSSLPRFGWLGQPVAQKKELPRFGPARALPSGSVSTWEVFCFFLGWPKGNPTSKRSNRAPLSLRGARGTCLPCLNSCSLHSKFQHPDAESCEHKAK